MIFRKIILALIFCCVIAQILPMDYSSPGFKGKLSKQEKALIDDADVRLLNGEKVKYRKYMSEFKKLRAFISNPNCDELTINSRLNILHALFNKCHKPLLTIKTKYPCHYRILKDIGFVSESGEVISRIVGDIMIRFAKYDGEHIILLYPNFFL